MKGFKHNAELPVPNYTDVFRLLNEQDIYSYYIPNLVFNTTISSPLGEKDTRPSFNVFWSYRKHKFIFKEFRYGYTGDCVDFVRYDNNYPTNTKACMKIFKDFGIEGFKIDDDIESSGLVNHVKVNRSIPVKQSARIKVTVRDWEDYDLAFWGKVGITLDWLKRGRIFPISFYYLNGGIRKADKYAYAYVEEKDNKLTFKIYQPFNKAGAKWRSNNNASVWELWELLPKTHDYLIITKSRKDALSIMATTGIPSTALQAEGTIPKEIVMDELKRRFKRIFFFYDNDFDSSENWGQNYSEKLTKLFGRPSICVPDSYQAKDYTDTIEKYSIQEAVDMLWTLIN